MKHVMDSKAQTKKTHKSKKELKDDLSSVSEELPNELGTANDSHQTEKELKVALSSFDAATIESVWKSGFNLADYLPDVKRQRNCIHELCRILVTLEAEGRKAATHVKFIDTLSILVKAGVSVNFTDFKRQTALHLLASSRECLPNALRGLVSCGAKV